MPALRGSREVLVAAIHPAQCPYPAGQRRLLDLIKSAPPTLKWEHGVILAADDYVIVHSRYSGNGRRSAWVVADIVRMENGLLTEHWDVIQDEATEADSKSGKPIFGDSFPAPTGK